MDLDVLKRTAREDLPVTDQEHIDQESYKNQMIKQKWLDFKADFELLLVKAKTDHQQLYRQKWEYFLGKMDDTERLALEWPPQPLKILSVNVHIYIEGDAAIQYLLKRKAYLEEILKFVEDVIKSINTRNFVIKSAIDFLRFKNGL